jgi:type II secretory ATPase GspE/PulE/Tfp pilus assembly ATPase PilB-like protein
VASDPLRELIVARENAMRIRQQALKEGMVTLRQDGWRKVLAGMTTLEEVCRVTAGDIVL